MDFLNSRATLVFLLAVIAVAAIVYYSKPEHQGTGMGQVLQKLSYTVQNPAGQNANQQQRPQTQDMGNQLMQQVE